MTARDARGFTLVETMVALFVGALVIAMAHAVFTGALNASERGRTLAHAMDRRANRREWLVRALGGLDGSRGFTGVRMGAGAGAHLSFTSRGRLGVPAPATVSVTVDGAELIGRIETASAGRSDSLRLVLADSVAGFDADYLVEYGENAQWVEEWVSPATAPIAARFRIGHFDGTSDTLLLLIGPS